MFGTKSSGDPHIHQSLGIPSNCEEGSEVPHQPQAVLCSLLSKHPTSTLLLPTLPSQTYFSAVQRMTIHPESTQVMNPLLCTPLYSPPDPSRSWGHMSEKINLRPQVSQSFPVLHSSPNSQLLKGHSVGEESDGTILYSPTQILLPSPPLPCLPYPTPSPFSHLRGHNAIRKIK